MRKEKLDSRLQDLLENAESEDRPVEVIIEHYERPEGQSIVELEADVLGKQQGIMSQLRDMGVEEPLEHKINIFSNSLVTQLTRSQVDEISERSDVKSLRLSRMDNVEAEL